jgi:lysylphosphatidylglycerol synthetase-like protein (DUF2156 family)
MADTVLYHPNQEKASSKATKSGVILLLLASAALLLIITVAGYNVFQGATLVAVIFALVYLVIAFYVARWKGGLLAVSAALAVLLGIFATVAAPSWFTREKPDFTDPLLPASLIGLLVLILVGVQALLIAFSARGFSQKWSVEIEVSRERYEREHGG